MIQVMTQRAFIRWLEHGIVAVAASVASGIPGAGAQEFDDAPTEAPSDEAESEGELDDEFDDTPEESSDGAAEDTTASEAADPEPANGEPDDAEPEDQEPSRLDPHSQTPEPVALADLPDPPIRLVDVGLFMGYTVRPSDHSLISYGPALTWGVYLRPEITSWLGVRLYYRRESVPVTVNRGGFEQAAWPLGATDFHQPNLSLLSLGARAEPTWVINPRLRLSGIVGIGWVRFVAPAPVSDGDLHIQTASRSAVELNPHFGASVSFDLIPHWLIATAAFTHGISINRSGDAYDRVQAFANGSRLQLGPLPHFQGVSDALLSLGLLL